MLSSTFSFSDGDIIQLVVVTVRAHVLCVLSCRLFLKRVHGGTFPAFDSSQPDPGCAVEFGMLQPLVDPTYDHDAPGLDVSVHTHTHTHALHQRNAQQSSSTQLAASTQQPPAPACVSCPVPPVKSMTPGRPSAFCLVWCCLCCCSWTVLHSTTRKIPKSG